MPIFVRWLPLVLLLSACESKKEPASSSHVNAPLTLASAEPSASASALASASAPSAPQAAPEAKLEINSLAWIPKKNALSIDANGLVVLDLGKPEPSLREICTDSPNNYQWNADGTRLVSRGCGGDFILWDHETGKKLYENEEIFYGHGYFTPDGTILLATSGDGHMKWIDAKTGKLLAERRHADFESGLTATLTPYFSPVGTSALVHDDRDEHVLFSGEYGKSQFPIKLPAQDRLQNFDWHPNGKQILVSTQEGSLILFDSNAKVVWKKKFPAGSSADYTNERRLIVRYGKDKLETRDEKLGSAKTIAQDVSRFSVHQNGERLMWLTNKGNVRVAKNDGTEVVEVQGKFDVENAQWNLYADLGRGSVQEPKQLTIFEATNGTSIAKVPLPEDARLLGEEKLGLIAYIDADIRLIRIRDGATLSLHVERAKNKLEMLFYTADGHYFGNDDIAKKVLGSKLVKVEGASLVTTFIAEATKR